MTRKTKIILAVGGLLLIAFLVLIGFGKRGAVDLYQLTLERDRLKKGNDAIQEENQALYKTIERLKSDPELLENIARTELGMTSKDEVVVLRKKKKQ
jgi:cell division protein FtsB